MALTRIESIDRTIFEYTRLAVVAAGYLPNVTSYATASLYKSAKDAMRASLPDKQLIEVYGIGAAESRDEKTVNKIIIDRIGFIKGGTGGFPATKYEQTGSGAGATFKKFMYPAASKNVRYEIRYITNSAKFDRIIMQLIEDTFGDRVYLKTVQVSGSTVTLDGQEILIDQTNFVDASSTDLIERVYTFTVPDVWIQEFKQIGGTIVPMSTVHVDMYYNDATMEDTLGDHLDIDIPS